MERPSAGAPRLACLQDTPAACRFACKRSLTVPPAVRPTWGYCPAPHHLPPRDTTAGVLSRSARRPGRGAILPGVLPEILHGFCLANVDSAVIVISYGID